MFAEYLRLARGGLFLDRDVYQEQSRSPESLKRGLLLVVLIGLAVGFASFVGEVSEVLMSRNRADVNRTIYEGLINMPWYRNVSLLTPGFDEDFKEIFDNVTTVLDTLNGKSIVNGVAGLVITPISYLLVWLVYGIVAHLMARLLGGSGTLTKTLGGTALAASANLLSLVSLVPFAQVSGVFALALIANYVAIREVHEMAPWRAFWATILGPLLLVVLLILAGCVGVFALTGGNG